MQDMDYKLQDSIGEESVSLTADQIAEILVENKRLRAENQGQANQIEDLANQVQDMATLNQDQATKIKEFKRLLNQLLIVSKKKTDLSIPRE